MYQKSNYRKYYEISPTIGILVFICLYFYSSTLYPGGSQADMNSIGFDWVHNYWCNLMSETGINKISNPARPFSILAMIILCISLAIFFIQFATKFSTGLFWKNTIRISGTLSMIFAILIFTKYHDLMTILSSFFAVFVVAGIIRQIYKSKMTLFKISGIVCIVFLVLNNYIYYSEHFIKVLPLLQKITFAFILIWILGLNHKLIHYNSINKTT